MDYDKAQIMAVRIFVSSTSQDLKEVCRLPAIRIIDSYQPNATAEAMEKWNEDHVDAIVVCKSKLEASTHYVGIFAYRRGWVPTHVDLENRSITEAEYDWAIELKKIPYILIPSPDSEIGRELRRDALGQSETDLRQQTAFVSRVRNNGVVKLFETSIEFEDSIRNKVKEWVRKNGKSLLAHIDAIRETDSPAAVDPVDDKATQTEESSLQSISPHQIGRIDHLFAFNNANRLTRRKSVYAATCYLIYGADGNGHSNLIQELRNELEPTHQYFVVSCLSVLDEVDADNLHEQIWQSVSDGSEDFAFDEMVKLIAKKLQFQDIVIEVNHVEEFVGDLPRFIADFWAPLNTAIETDSQHRLIIFAAYRQTDISDIEDQVHFIAQQRKHFDSAKLVALPELVSIEVDDIQDWLEENYPDMSETNIAEQTTRLLKKSKGNPEKLYSILNSIQKTRR